MPAMVIPLRRALETPIEEVFVFRRFRFHFDDCFTVFGGVLFADGLAAAVR